LTQMNWRILFAKPQLPCSQIAFVLQLWMKLRNQSKSVQEEPRADLRLFHYPQMTLESPYPPWALFWESAWWVLL
jgi:hypothetical protein